jgi:hypothetical protein
MLSDPMIQMENAVNVHSIPYMDVAQASDAA